MNNLDKIKTMQPLIICYTNDVVKHFTANGLLSLGASPAMSEAPEEATEMLSVAQALLINIGTITKDRAKDMLEIAKIANKVGTPVIFDPVAVGASDFRKQFCKQFIEEIDIAVIKGNASEVLALIDDETTMKGTDSDVNLDAIDIARKALDQLQTAIVITGKEDIIAQDNKVIQLANGSSLLTRITGAGCLLGAIVGAFLTEKGKVQIQQLEEAVAIYNIAAEAAEQLAGHQGPASFMTALLDALYHISYDDYLKSNRRTEV
ncbi:hydroxyethylthiazole kinase [Staphylococcus gallinarum]|uniref:hydroxyethylthiazole kinase n=1 Tax=Staphylococcus gallinarum TaxID=1293 RepID=UPI001E50CE0A|nr:hydroxyethylthiazole kinase [Staphylococcus gallinarum]MCD8901123.1 hydroxyethylthiazole kinase [Staphylococcus gallinarum]MEB6238615.1 hydroxyethylthiazole kinase [Staphylococcus gallinarum]